MRGRLCAPHCVRPCGGNRYLCFLPFAMAAFNALSYYLVVAFVPTYLVSFVKVDHAVAMRVATVASAFNVAFIAIPAWVSDAAWGLSSSFIPYTSCFPAEGWLQCSLVRLGSSCWRRVSWGQP